MRVSGRMVCRTSSNEVTCVEVCLCKFCANSGYSEEVRAEFELVEATRYGGFIWIHVRWNDFGS